MYSWLKRLLSEAIAAVNGTIAARFEGNLAGSAATGADRIEHLAGFAAAGSLLTGRAARLAALRFVRKALLGVEFLLAGSEGEVLAAVFANQGFVAEHV